MGSSKEYLNFIMEQLSQLENITFREMMGEFLIYYQGKLVGGGIYDNRFLVKPLKSAREMMPGATMDIPYEGAKEMMLVNNVDNKDFLREMITRIYEELPGKSRKTKLKSDVC